MTTAWIQSTSLYLQINGWPPNQLEPDWPTAHSLKLSQRHCSKLHAEYYISLMILPRSSDSVSLSVYFFSSVALSRSLSLLFFATASNSVFLPVSMKVCFGNESTNIKEQYFWRSRGWILTFCNKPIVPNGRKVLWNVWNHEWYLETLQRFPQT